RVLDLGAQTGDQTGQARIHYNLGYLWEQRGDYPGHWTTPGRPSACSRPPATRLGRPAPSTWSAGNTPSSAITTRPSPTVSTPSPCSRTSATATGRRLRGTASATPTTTPATTPPPSPTTTTPSPRSSTSATDPAKRPYSTTPP